MPDARSWIPSLLLAGLAWPAPLPPSPATPQELVVRATTRLGRDVEGVPEIDFEVLRRGERSVEVSGAFGPGRAYEVGERIAFGETDARGEARIVLPDDVGTDEHGLPAVIVRVVEPGYQQQTARVGIPRGSDTPVARLLPLRGATARGRVVDAEGNGVLADVRVERWVDEQRGRLLRAVEFGRPLPDGRFELHLDEDHPAALLIAEAEDVGSARLSGVDLLLADPPQDLALTVVGQGTLRGSVVGADGRPVPGLPLVVRLAAVDGDAYSAREPELSLRRAEGLGRCEVLAVTDGQGRFDVRGLRREPHVVRARLDLASTGGYTTVLTPRPVVADGDELRLVVTEPQLLVRVLDARGAPWSGEPLALREGGAWARTPQGWHASPRVTVHPASPIGREPEVTGAALELRGVALHEAACSVEAGARYLVAVRGADFVEPARLVEVPAAGGRVEVEVRAAPPVAWGTLRIRITTDRSGGDYEVALEDPATGLRLCDVDAPLGAVPSVRAPVGRYRVVAEGRTSTDLFHGTIMTLRALGRAEAEVDVLADTTTDVPIELRAGATLDLELAGTSTDADREALLREQPVLGLANNAATLAMYVSSAEVRLLRPRRGPEPVYRIFRLEGTSAAGKHLWNAWPLNERHASVPVAAGAWTLVARMPGGREVSREVVLRAGETTQVRLAFGD